MVKYKDVIMATKYGNAAEKVTFNMPLELKEQVMILKDELQISLSAIYKEAISNYVKQKELEKWHHGVSMALKDKEYNLFQDDIDHDDGGLYDY